MHTVCQTGKQASVTLAVTYISQTFLLNMQIRCWLTHLYSFRTCNSFRWNSLSRWCVLTTRFSNYEADFLRKCLSSDSFLLSSTTMVHAVQNSLPLLACRTPEVSSRDLWVNVRSLRLQIWKQGSEFSEVITGHGWRELPKLLFILQLNLYMCLKQKECKNAMFEHCIEGVGWKSFNQPASLNGYSFLTHSDTE